MSNAMDFAARLILKESAKKLLEDTETLLDTIENEQKEENAEHTEDVETEVDENTDEFQESLDDMIFFCANCNKHFIATKDTPEDMICCPVCDNRDLIVNVGSAEQALENPENEEVAEELEDQEEKEEPAENLEDETEAEDDVDQEEDPDEGQLVHASDLLAEEVHDGVAGVAFIHHDGDCPGQADRQGNP